MTLADKGDEQPLWRAVITQAIEDATTFSSVARVAIDRDQARKWFTDNGSDFRDVCALADLDPLKVRAYALKRIAEADANPIVRTFRRKIKTYEHDGERLTIDEWSSRLGINASTLSSRLKNGWTLDRALTTPVTIGRPKRKTLPGVGQNFLEAPRDRCGRHAQDRPKIEIFS